ncbi:MADF domain-containing protein, partial [Aphis craccivora]
MEDRFVNLKCLCLIFLFLNYITIIYVQIMEWSRSITTEFIELYQSKQCLWKISSVEYKNKNLKSVAYNELVEFLKSKGLVSATVKEVKSKIQNIRRMVRKERAKVEASSRSGRGTDDLYYDLLSFTSDMDPLQSIDNLGGTNNYSSEIDEENDCNILELTENDSQYCEQNVDSEILSNANDDQNHSLSILNNYVTIKKLFLKDYFHFLGSFIDLLQNIYLTINLKKLVFQIPSSPLRSKKTKKQKMDDNVSNFMKKCTEALENTNDNKPDEYEAMDINFAAKLKKMKPEQQIYAELLFQKVCAKGLLGQLHERYDIVDISNNQQTPQLLNDHYTAVYFPREYYSTSSIMAYPNSNSSTESSESPATSVQIKLLHKIVTYKLKEKTYNM